jgi:hypothetical protein
MHCAGRVGWRFVFDGPNGFAQFRLVGADGSWMGNSLSKVGLFLPPRRHPLTDGELLARAAIWAIEVHLQFAGVVFVLGDDA